MAQAQEEGGFESPFLDCKKMVRGMCGFSQSQCGRQVAVPKISYTYFMAVPLEMTPSSLQKNGS
jgi:hypothetical protein